MNSYPIQVPCQLSLPPKLPLPKVQTYKTEHAAAEGFVQLHSRDIVKLWDFSCRIIGIGILF